MSILLIKVINLNIINFKSFLLMFYLFHSRLFFYFSHYHHSQSKVSLSIIIQLLFLINFLYLDLTQASSLILLSILYYFRHLLIQHRSHHFIKNHHHQKNCLLLNFLSLGTNLYYFPSNYLYKLSINNLNFSMKYRNDLLVLIKISTYAFLHHYLF